MATSGGIVLGRDSRRSSIRATASGTFHRVAAVTLCLILSGRGNATVSGRREVGAAPTTGPAVVYVTDFELDAQRIKAETSPLPPPPGPLGGILPKPPGTPKEPAVRARELVNPMATSLVEELTKAGLNARRLSAGEPRPAQGWLVRGIFTQLDEGNRMRRAVIGFGAGQTQMQVAVAVDDLSQGVPKPLYETDVSADSGKMPGAGSMIALAPPVAAARFALAGRDQERSVRRAAAKIASDVVGRIRKGNLRRVRGATMTIGVYPTPEQIQKLLAPPDDGRPVVMVNLLRFKPTGDASGATGEELYQRYARKMIPFVESKGGRLIWSGRVDSQVIGEGGDAFHMVGLVEYPSRKVFVEIATDAYVQEIGADRALGLEGQWLLAATTEAV